MLHQIFSRIGLMTSVICFTLLLTFQDGQCAELKAGVARIDLTPPLEMNSPLGGYGERMNRPAVGVHDRIFAKAIVFFNGNSKFALVTADFLGFSPPIKADIISKLSGEGWDESQLMLLASHSHTSIEMNAINPINTFKIPQIGIHDQKLYEFTIDKFVSLIREAEKNPVPVRVGTSRIQLEGWNRNRSVKNGPVDPDLTITRIDSEDGTALAAIVNFTAHPTFMGANEMLFSGGWPGYLQRTMESLIGDDVIVMYHNGAEGDQAPSSRPDSGGSAWERAGRYGTDLGIVCWKQWQKTHTSKEVVFKFNRQEIDLPENSWHPNFMATGGTEYGLSEEILKEMLPTMFPRKTFSVSLRLGDMVIVGIPGEMAADLGMNIKEKTAQATGAKYPVIGGLADVWISYILSEKQYLKGQYEASVSFYGPTLGPRLTEQVLVGSTQLTE